MYNADWTVLWNLFCIITTAYLVVYMILPRVMAYVMAYVIAYAAVFTKVDLDIQDDIIIFTIVKSKSIIVVNIQKLVVDFTLRKAIRKGIKKSEINFKGE